MRRFLLLAAFVGLAAFAPTASADLIVVPNSLAAVEGNSNNGFPFNITPFGLASQRYQQVYNANQFTNAGMITAITFRPDADTGNAFASVLSNVQINLSTTSAGPDGLSSTFASNVGGNNQTVFSGALALSSADTAGPGGTRAFDITIALNTPFFYDPSQGNLLLDVRNFAGGTTTQFDAHTVTGDSISRGFTNVVGGVGNATGLTDTSGLVTQFQIQAVPEPVSMIVFGGLAVAGIVGYRRRKQATV